MEQTARTKRGFSSPEGAEEQDTFVEKRPKTLVKQEEDDGDLLAWLNMDDDSAIELYKIFETEFVAPPPFKLKISSTPFSSPKIFQASASYITINSNGDESCGSSFSDANSSVMASVDLGCLCFDSGKSGIMEHGGARDKVVVARESVSEGDGQMDGRKSGFDFDDDMLASFLGEDFVGTN
ncbi:hypothetical protein DCAR_0830749 [Daucus carota subsp. sativus]|uniref:Uncharacterized protein n=1 Tax=Daucus carota subsp. sativus TaxID=79200 RepID=A0A175YLH7_DAUCS|nr:PREDICTED: uncharacterized protein LOC108198052 [Daucus carota subsp. sativus]WOH11268.1 hypothetical protein DCAR_0830749 [Daucus carota subsp. sativus]